MALIALELVRLALPRLLGDARTAVRILASPNRPKMLPDKRLHATASDPLREEHD